MDERERFERGMAKRRRVLGNAWVDRSLANRTALNEDFLDLITRYAWEEFRLHVRAALTEGGFTVADLKEIIHQQAVYVGVPAANTAIKETAEVLAEIGRD